MSDSTLPEYVDARKIFAQRGVVTGSLGLDRLERVLDRLADSQGEAVVTLRFETDDFGRRVITGELSAHVNMICQRCLDPLRVDLEDSIALQVVADEEAAGNVAEPFDPWMCPDFRINLVHLVDEQLALCMPIVSLHDPEKCNASRSFTTDDSNGPQASGQSPFAVLENLKSS